MAGTGRWLAPDARNGRFRVYVLAFAGVVACVVLAAGLIDVLFTGGSVLRIGTLVLVGALASIAGSVVLARYMRPPIAALEVACAALEQAVEDRTRELSATAKILRVISSSPSDVQPVLDAVADNAARLCGASDALIMGVDGDSMHRIAHVGVITSASERRPVTRNTPTGRAILEARTIHVEDILEDFAGGEYLEARPLQQATGFRTVLVVPLTRDGRVIGALTIRRLDVQGFTPQQIALVETFADQAVIAIENVRLFKELAIRNTALTEALDQQTTTAEILRVISGSPTDVQPVLDAVARSATRICGATDAFIVRVEGSMIRRVAHFGPVPLVAPELRRIDGGSVTGHAIRERRAIHVADVLDTDSAQRYPESAALHHGTGVRTSLSVPLVRDGVAIGAITIRRTEVVPFTDTQVALLETFADQAVIAIENVRLFKELEARNTALTEALGQQTATSEILRVISSSPTDLQPVLDTVAENAARVCGATDALIVRAEGGLVRRVAHVGALAPVLAEARPISRLTISGRAMLEARTIHLADVTEPAVIEEFPEGSPAAAGGRWRTHLTVPLMRQGEAIGAITIRREEVRPFSDKQIALLQTFAAQAVIAIENVRLFKELQTRNDALRESLEQQTATADILRVISHSPTDVQPVLDAVADNAKRICGASDALIMRADGDVMRRVAHVGAVPASLAPVRPLNRDSVAGRAIIERRAVQVEDVGDAAAAREYPESWALTATLGLRTVTAVPLLRDDAAIGAIVIRRTEVRPFTDKQMALLQTFADQAVIAIENVRLFKELQTRNAALRESLDQQTATAEILRAISGSPTDVQPVFDTIVHSAARLLDGHSANVLRVVGDELHLAALTSTSETADAASRATFPVPISVAGVAGHVIDTRRPYIVADVESDPFVSDRLRITAPLRGFRSMLAVPMIHHDGPIGLITVTRRRPGAFSEDEISLLQTFADQAVIAIENVRLFNELEARNAALSQALDQQTATAEVLKVISSSPTDVQPVLDAVAENATRVCGATDALIMRVEGDTVRRVAHFGEFPLVLPAVRPLTSRGAGSRAIRERRTIHVPDILEPDAIAEYPDLAALAEQTNLRTHLAVPLIREGIAIGAIVIRRREVRAFTDRQIALLETFADQAVIAIENVRLFKELEQKNRALTDANTEVTETLEQQTATTEILRVISSSQTDVQPVFDAIAVNASRLCGGARAVVLRYDRGLIHRVAATGSSPALRHEMDRLYPRPADESSLVGRAIVRRAVVHSPDVMREPGLQTSSMAPLGIGAQLSVPMLHDHQPIGVIAVSRSQPGAFTDKQIELIKTFADQAVIAIENVRLFKELEARNAALSESLDQQTATAEILRVISSSPTNVQPVLEVVARSAARICAASDALIFQVEGGVIHRLAHVGSVPFILPGARPLEHGSVTAGAIRERRIVHVPDILDPEARRQYSESAATSPETGVRTLLAVPLMRDDVAVGAITIRRTEARPFSDKQIELLETFADQAVIAIENVRLFKELEARNAALAESLDQQTATAEILSVISASPTNVQPVLDVVARNAARVCGASDAVIHLVEDDRTRRVAHFGALPVQLAGEGLPVTRTIRRTSVLGRAILERHTVQVRDLLDEAVAEEFAEGVDLARRMGHRTVMATPLMREGVAIGAIIMRRADVRPFSDEQITLLETFARQAVIAIENVRLFNEIQQKTRELEAANRHKDEFLASMSHELRTPLNAVIGFSEVLLERMFGDVNGKQEEYLHDILASGRHLLSLINDILDLAKIEAGRMELELEDFDLGQAIDNAVVLVRERATRKGLSLDTRLDRDLGSLRGDQRKIKQILLNLLSNAVKFTPEGGRIEVRAMRLNGHVEIAVTDTGIGIAAEDLDAVFEEFRQVGTDYAKKHEGTGLGLTLSRKFVELHGGRIWVKSQPGKGSTFAFTLPGKP